MFSLITRTVALRTGFDFDHVKSIAQELGGCADPVKDTALLLLALFSDAKPESAARVAKQLWHLESEGMTLGKTLEDYIKTFLALERTDFSKVAYNSAFEIYDVPAVELRIRTTTPQQPAKITFGDKWAGGKGLINSRFLTGKHLFDICADITLAGEVTYV